ncbi:MAG: DUF6653 family protein [Alphaproteobacteria bacterium]
MAWDRQIAALFRMDERAWARHANPWSVWTRMATLPLIALAAWSRVWIGWWWLAALGLALAWTWINPRLFPPPGSTESWASRAVLGERLWLDRERIAVPRHHRRIPHVLSAVAALGGAILVWGLATLDPWPTLLGLMVAFLGKLWFVDRMVWLHADMQAAHAGDGAARR